MNRKSFYNNIGITALSIAIVVARTSSMPLSKTLLVLPIITHKELLNYLSDGKVKIKSLDKLIIEKTSCFSNFNRRYYDNICNSLNAIQLLNDIELAQVKDSQISINPDFSFNETMGRRANKVNKAADNIMKVLDDNVEKLYLNLRVEL